MIPAAHNAEPLSRLSQVPYKRAQLLDAIRTLEDAGQQSTHSDIKHAQANRRVAIAEAYFRLAIMPGTELPESLAYMQKAVEHDPFHPKLFFHLGRLLHRGGAYREAIQSYRQALKLAPTSHRAYVHLAIALLELEESGKTLGRSILEILMRGDEAKLAELLVDLDALMEAQRAAAEGKKRQPPTRTKASDSGNGAASSPTTSCRWNGIWRLSLVELLSRQKFIRKQIDKQLEVGAQFLKDNQGVAEYAVACLFLLLCGDSLKDTAKEVKRLLDGPAMKSYAEHAAVRLVHATATLAAIEQPADFVAQAVEASQAELLPTELICYLHYAKYGPQQSLSIEESLRLLNVYPQNLQKHSCFQELRIAILELYARRAWSDERFEHAKLLWRETIPLDPNRIAVAHNLALVAARTKSRDDYGPAWQRAFELRYLHAAASGDVQVLLEERRIMHLSFVQQIEQRYRDFSKESDPDKQKKENIEAWLADRDALDTWLREWDLYYLNSRLRFRSPVHLLGVPRDADVEAVTQARDALLRQIDICMRPQPWSGIKVFCELADALVNQAAERANDLVARARDPYYEEEKAEADALTQETIKHGFLLGLDMLAALSTDPDSQKIALGAAVGQRLFALPWKILQPSCAARGLIPYDLNLTERFEDEFLWIALSEQSEPKSEREATQRLKALDEYISILPYRVELCVARCRLLLSSKRKEAAYTSAINALPLIAQVKNAEKAERLENSLLALADEAAHEAMPPRLIKIQNASGGMTREEAESILQAGNSVLERFPRATGFRLYLCKLHIQLGGPQHVAQATHLLKQGIELALTEKQRTDVLDLLGRADSQAKTAVVLAEIKKLLESASQSAQGIIEEIKQDASKESVAKGLEVVARAIQDVEHAMKLAVEADLNEARGQAEKLQRQLRDVEQRLRQL